MLRPQPGLRGDYRILPSSLLAHGKNPDPYEKTQAPDEKNAHGHGDLE